MEKAFEVAKGGATREATSSLSVCPWKWHTQETNPSKGGFLECATFLHFTTRLL
jgi:hypothetical protein